MPTYSTFAYNDGTLYGEPSRIAFSAEPVVATPLDYGKVSISWSIPTGSIQAMRLVRNQEGFPETAEDGVILFEGEGAQGVPSPFVDGEDTAEGTIPLIEGRFAYYRIWLLRVDQNWYSAGDAVALVPRNHSLKTSDGDVLLSSTYKFLDVLPRAAVSSQGNILDEVDPNSALFNFISGFSFTLDELYTYADSVLPNVSGEYLNPRSLPLKLSDLGMLSEPNLGTKGQKRLIREAKYMYNRKGTLTAFGTLVESATGYSPTIAETPNLMLSMDDSTFLDGLGNWASDSSDVVLSRVNNQAIPTEEYAVENTWVAKISATGNGILSNGLDAVNYGIPIAPGTEYTFSGYFRTDEAEAPSGSLYINWYDRTGDLLGVDTVAIPYFSAGWNKEELTATAPGFRPNVTTGVIVDSVATVTTLEDHNFSVGDDVRLFDISSDYSSFFGIVTITDVPDAKSFSFETTLSSKDLEDLNGTAVLLSGNETDGFKIVEAKYASIQVEIDGPGVLYMDMLQFAESSVTDYYEPRGVTVHLAPNKVNLLTNPSFSTDSGVPDGWTVQGTGITSLVEDSTLNLTRSGSHMLGINAASGTEAYVYSMVNDVQTGNFYTFSVYLENTEADTTVDLKIIAYALDDELYLAEETVTVPLVADTWGRHHVSVFVPYYAGGAGLQVGVYSVADGNHLHFDSAQLERSYANPSDYFDGDYNSIGAIWTGTANASESYFYINREIKLDRLQSFLPDHLPLRSPYTITIGKETSPILKLKGIA